jgi:DNA-binding response OmpR family regulator
MTYIILVEPDLAFATSLEQAIAGNAIQIDIFADIASASLALKSRRYALRVIRRELPDGNGLVLLQEGQTGFQRIPSLLVSGCDLLHERLEGLALGADDYLVSPFAVEEFSARIRALLRRAPITPNTVSAPGGLQVDCEALLLRHERLDVSLSQTEIDILRCLIQADGHTVMRNKLEQVAWGYGRTLSLNTLNVTLSRLRRKLRSVHANCQILHNRGNGYALLEQE